MWRAILISIVDFIVNAVAESLNDLGTVRAKHSEHEQRIDNMSYQLEQLKSDYKALQEKVIKLDEARWRRVCDNIMLEGLLVKFTDPKLKSIIVAYWR